MARPAGLSRRGVLLAGAAVGLTAGSNGWAGLESRARFGGADLPELPDLPLQYSGGEARGRLAATPIDFEVLGEVVTLFGYEGRFPGPIIRLRHTETLALDFANMLPESTNLHTHGLSVSPRGEGDNPFRRIQPGETARYYVPLRGDPRNGGLHWYHPHLHGFQATQLYRGLAGPIVVSGPEDPDAHLGPCDERIIVLKDLRLRASSLALHRPADWFTGLEGDIPLLNGAYRPVLKARERRLRLRLINASNARYWRLEPPPEHAVNIVALDGHTLEGPKPADEILLAPAQRVDVVIDLKGQEPFDVVDRPVARGSSLSRRSEPVLTIVPPRSKARPAPLPARFLSRKPFDAERNVAAKRNVVFSLFYINGLPHQTHHDEPMFRPRFGTKEIWEVRNVDTMDHPFHLHTWPFRVLARNGVSVPGQVLRDTISLGPGEAVALGIDFTGVSGRSVFHCHIVEHATKGMMAIVEVG
jgi:FtsP/CotA-like multicopper oxidase with cupredoxin domain